MELQQTCIWYGVHHAQWQAMCMSILSLTGKNRKSRWSLIVSWGTLLGLLPWASDVVVAMANTPQSAPPCCFGLSPISMWQFAPNRFAWSTDAYRETYISTLLNEYCMVVATIQWLPQEWMICNTWEVPSVGYGLSVCLLSSSVDCSPTRSLNFIWKIIWAKLRCLSVSWPPWELRKFFLLHQHHR